MKLFGASLVILLSMYGHGHATGGLDCSVNDESIELDVSGSLSRSLEMHYIESRGTLLIKLPGIESMATELDLQNKIVHSWITNDEIRFQFYADPLKGRDGAEGFKDGIMNLYIVTKNTGKDTDIGSAFEGTYDLSVSYVMSGAGAETKAFSAQGTVSCEMY
jgi:hypothetical protein